jgi:protease I
MTRKRRWAVSLDGLTVVVLAYPGYQELEFWYPVFRAREEGARVQIVTPSSEPCDSFLGYPVIGDADPDAIDASDVAAIVAPGTVHGSPAASTRQLELLRRVAAGGGLVYAAGSGSELVAGAAKSVDGPDDIANLVQMMIKDVAGRAPATPPNAR